MKKLLCAVSLATLLFSMTACSSSQSFTPDYESAVGVIFVNDEQELPENTKVYADFEDNSYTFDLDAAYVYYFSASADEPMLAIKTLPACHLGQIWTMTP